MKHLYFTTKRKWLLLLGALALHLTAHAQGMELFSLTQTSKTVAEKAVPAPPVVSVLNNDFLIERNFNLQLAEIAPKLVPSELPRIKAEIKQVQEAIDFKSAIRTIIENQAKNANKPLEQDTAYKATQKQINTLTEKRSNLEQAYYSKAKEEAGATQIRKAVQGALQLQLNLIYDRQLRNLRSSSDENKRAYRQALDSRHTAVEKIRAYQNKYWDSIPDPTLESTVMREADKAHWQFYRKLVKLESQLAEANTAYAAFKASKDSLDAYTLNIADTSATSRVAYNKYVRSIQRTNTPVAIKLDTLQNTLTRYNQQVAKWQEAFKAAQDKKAASSNNVTAPVALTSLKGASLYIPSVSVIGSHRGGDDDSPTISSIKLFTALGGPDKDVRSKRGTERLFIPDASTFGFSADIAFSFTHPARKSPVMGIVLGASYLDKLMTPDSSMTFTTGIVTARVSLEYYLIPDVLMVYGGFNSLTFLTDRDLVTEHYTTARPKDVYGFTNAGVRAILKPGGSDKSGISFLFDLGFVFKGDNVKSFVPNDDFTITTIRATVAKNFALR